VVQKPDIRGPVYAALSAIAVAVAPITTKQALAAVNIETFSFLWSLVAFIGASTYALNKKSLNTFRTFRQCWLSVFGIGLLTAATVLIYSKAIQLSDPTFVSFFTRLEAVFTVLLGMLVFKERLTLLELLGATTTISGALIMTYKAQEIVLLAFMLSLIVALFVSIRTLLGKVAIQYMESAVVVAVSRLITCLFNLLYVIAFGVWQWPSITSLLLIIIGALSGAFLSFMFVYKALSIYEVSKVTVIRVSIPFFVALYSFLLFHTIPSPRQMLGGGIIVAGILALIIGQRRRWSHNRDSNVSM
jgi:drug/metabolite transporter (DMT)-like permease